MTLSLDADSKSSIAYSIWPAAGVIAVPLYKIVNLRNQNYSFYYKLKRSLILDHNFSSNVSLLSSSSSGNITEVLRTL